MVGVILLLMTFTSLAFSQPVPLYVSTKSSTATSRTTMASLNAVGSLRSTKRPKAVSQEQRVLRFLRILPKVTANANATTSPKVTVPRKTALEIQKFYNLMNSILWGLGRNNKTTTFATATAIANATTSPKAVETRKTEPDFTELWKLIMKVSTDYEGRYSEGDSINGCNSLDKVQEDLKHAWSVIMKEGRRHSSGEMNDLQKFLKKVVEDYNLCIEQHFYADSEAEWRNYIIAFGKEYTPEEEGTRKAMFMKKKEYMEEDIELFRRGKISYGTKLNHLSDRTREELEKMKGFRQLKLFTKSKHPAAMVPQNNTRYYHGIPDSEVPTSIDWRTECYVTPVGFQGSCSSCYAFAGIGALEAYHKKKTGNLISLSVQNILDCTWNLGNDGCNGGFIRSVFEYARTMGIESEDRYPYTMNASHDCQWKKEQVAVLFDGYFHTVTKGNELALQHAIANHGPVATAIGTRGDFENYGYGIFHPHDCGPADHSVLIVGYGTDPVQGDYWIIKNSYGEWWGENGYIRIARNKNNACDLASHVIFPIFQ